MNSQRLHILLVEDEQAHAELMRRSFSSQPDRFDLTVKNNLKEAIEYLSKSRPDLVFADLNLPDGKGTELISANGPDVPFPYIIITSYGDEKIAVEALKAGALDYVAKSEATFADMPHITERALREWGHIIECKQAEAELQNHHRHLEERVAESTKEVKESNAKLHHEIQERKQREKEIRELTKRLIKTAEDERKKISRDLHDEFGQIMVALRLSMEALQKSIPDKHPDLIAICHDLGKLIELSSDKVRKISTSLHPDILDHLGLIPTLEWFIADLTDRKKDLPINLQAINMEKRLPTEIEFILFRIFQETMNNITKHAKARKVNIALRRSEADVVLTIEDDGIGFDLNKVLTLVETQNKGIGILSMQERVASVEGDIDIQTSKGKGTVVRTTLNLA